MRLAMLIFTAAVMLGGCEPAGSSSAAPAAEDVVADQSPSRARAAARGPEVPLRPMQAQPGDTEQARQQAEAAMRELDRTAATLGADIAGAAQRADEAVRKAEPRLPADPGPEPARREPEPTVKGAQGASPPQETPAPATPG